MATLELKLNLPDRLAQDATQMGLLEPVFCKRCYAKPCAIVVSRNWPRHVSG